MVAYSKDCGTWPRVNPLAFRSFSACGALVPAWSVASREVSSKSVSPLRPGRGGGSTARAARRGGRAARGAEAADHGGAATVRDHGHLVGLANAQDIDNLV